MKILKKLSISLFSTSFLFSPLAFCYSCSNNKTNSEQQEELAKHLDLFLEKNKEKLNLNCVNLKVQNSEKINLFSYLENHKSLDEYFEVDKSKLQFEKNVNIIFYFSFLYDFKDYYNELKTPSLSMDKKNVNIPVLIYIFDSETNVWISKYINLFSMKIIDSKVNDEEKYLNQDGKKIVFNETKSFRTIPNIILDEFFNFLILISEDNYKLGPIYKNQNDLVHNWKDKTLAQVREFPEAIVSPAAIHSTSNMIYSYYIVDSYFYGQNWNYAMYKMKIYLNDSIFSNFKDDAQKIYNFHFEYEYYITNETWSFAYPTEQEQEKYNENNYKIISEIKDEISNAKILYLPSVLVNKVYAQSLKVDEFIKKYMNNPNQAFKAPEAFFKDNKKINFSVSSISQSPNNENVITINIEISISEKNIYSSLIYSKEFNIKSWKFE